MIDSGVRVAIIGGCGHVGLPLGLCLASEAIYVSAVDVDDVAVRRVNSGNMPLEEAGALSLLEGTLRSGHFLATTDPSAVSQAETVIVVVGTPVDETLTPDPESIVGILSEYRPHLRDGQLLILRSTVYPGVTRRVEAFLEDSGWVGDVAFCPERILEGHAIREIRTLPQIVGARTPQALQRASALFASLGVRCLESTPEEAELAKLFSSMWRYIKFAAANEFWLVANEADQDYVRIRELMSTDYPRAADVPGAGFAAGPCLYKDTIQVSTYMSGRLPIGLAATTTNEDLPLYIVNKLARKFRLP